MIEGAHVIALVCLSLSLLVVHFLWQGLLQEWRCLVFCLPIVTFVCAGELTSHLFRTVDEEPQAFASCVLMCAHAPAGLALHFVLQVLWHERLAAF